MGKRQCQLKFFKAIAWSICGGSPMTQLIWSSGRRRISYEAARTYGIDFSLRGQDWVDWMVKRMVEMVRISKGLVAMVVEGQTRGFRWSAAPALLMADLHRRGVHLRKPPAFRRVGIPGSGGPDWLRNDYEFIVCCTSGGKLPWSDNTAMGHPPKWAPGGEMSYRQTDGSRLNQWGHPIDSGATIVDADGSVRSEGTRPSHVVADPWGKRGRGNNLGGRKANGQKLMGTNYDDEAGEYVKSDRDDYGFTEHAGDPSQTQRANGTKRKRLGRGMCNGLEGSTKGGTAYSIDPQTYPPPAIANPGNVIQRTYVADEVADMLGEAHDVINCIVGGGVMGDNLCHENEAPFPESLAEFFIRSFCPPAVCNSCGMPRHSSQQMCTSCGADLTHPGAVRPGIVYDPFSGSGTTSAVAVRFGRNSVATDVRQSQVELSRRRVAQVQPEMFA